MSTSLDELPKKDGWEVRWLVLGAWIGAPKATS